MKSFLTCLLIMVLYWSSCPPADAVETVSIYALLSRGNDYSEKEVITTGYFCLSGYNFSIHTDEESCSLSNYENAIGFELPVSDSFKHEEYGSGKTVRIQGVYRHSISNEKVSTTPYVGLLFNTKIIGVLDGGVNASAVEMTPSAKDQIRLMNSYTSFLEMASSGNMAGLLEYFGVGKENPSYDYALSRVAWVIQGSDNAFNKKGFNGLVLFKSTEQVSAVGEIFIGYKLCLSADDKLSKNQLKEANVHKMLSGDDSVCIEYTQKGEDNDAYLEAIGDGWVSM